MHSEVKEKHVVNSSTCITLTIITSGNVWYVKKLTQLNLKNLVLPQSAVVINTIENVKEKL